MDRHRSARAALSVVLSFTMVVAPGCGVGPAEEKRERAYKRQAAAPVGQGFTLNASDIRFILQQIKVAEDHVTPVGGPTPCEKMLGLGPNQIGDPRLPYGLRTVDGRCNNLIPGQFTYGAADKVFPRMTAPLYRPAENGTSYAQKSGLVVDSTPRVVSNLIVDQTIGNPAAVIAAGEGAEPEPSGALFIANVAPDVGLSAPFNSLFTLFGQFFDHGLDLVTKGGGTVFMPLHPDDPLFNPAPGAPNFMVLSRAANLPGPDGIPGTPDDIQEATNTTTPFVDQNQTYTSHPSHQVFLREYANGPDGRPVSTGRLLDGAIPGNIGNWSEVKAQAATLLGIQLEDVDVLNVPLLATDPYGRFLRGENGYPQVVFPGGVLVEGDPSAPISVAGAVKTGHAFLDDIAHHAVPFGDHDNNPTTPQQALTPDADPGTADDGNPATYDDELLGAHFVTGDGRGNENIGLTAIHLVFHSEHNRLVADIDGIIHTQLTPAEIAEWEAVNPGSGWDYGERLFQAARFVTEMEYQHLVFEEFARKVQPLVNLFSFYHTEIDPAIVAEFAHTVYRFGHSMLTESVDRVNANGSPNHIPLLDAFLNPLAFNDGGPAGQLDAARAAGSIVRGMARQVGNEIDEFVTEALRNNLLGLPLDLATINIARGRSEGVTTLNSARRQFFDQTGNFALFPYESWADFARGLRHPESVVNFVAAYGTHPSITAATTVAERRAAAELLVRGDILDPATPEDSLDFMLSTGTWQNAGDRVVTGVDDVDFWVGGLAEKQAPFGGLLGSTFNHVFELQLEKLQDGDRFYYLSRTAGLNLLVQLEGNSFAELIMRNTDAENLPADVFSRPDYLFNLANLGTSGPILDDPATEDYDESQMTDLVRMPNGTIRYTGPAHVIFIGRDLPGAIDRMWSSEGDDTMRGNGGRDFMEGGAGNDQFIGGEGDDVITDAFGDDVLKGGPGNDVLSSGAGFDLNQGGTGHDFIVGGSDPTETFGGPGNDLIYAGESDDIVFGDDGDDWIEGGAGADLLQGDNGAPFQNDPNTPGHDVIIGMGGDDDYDSEGGDDIMVAGPGIERNEGMLGFDWVTHRGDPQPANADFFRRGAFEPVPPDLDTLRDRYDLVEALSGWKFNDILRGDDRGGIGGGGGGPGGGGGGNGVADFEGHELTLSGIQRIAGLADVLPPGTTLFNTGNIILGGAGSDTIEGRGGDDVIDGDAWLNVQLRAPIPGTSDFQLVDSMTQLRTQALLGNINPGDISIVRSIVTGDSAPTDVDTAVFRGALAEYSITVNVDGSIVVDHLGGIDGRDFLRNIELLAFADQTIPAPQPTGSVTISDTTPAEDQLLTATVTGMPGATVTFQVETVPLSGLFQDVAQGASFTPGDAEVGLRLRALATLNEVTISSPPTAPVAPVNDAPVGAPALSTTTPQVGVALTVSTDGLSDPDGIGPFSFQWLADGSPIGDATAATFTPTAANVGQQLSARVSWTDGQGFAESLTTAPSNAVAAAGATPATGVAVTPSAPSPQIAGTAVTFTAQAQGTSSPAEYRFYFKELSAPAYTMVQDYGVGSSWTMPASTPPGTYRVLVYTRTSSSVLRDAMNGVNFTVQSEPATGLTVTPSAPSPQAAGTPITFTAQGIGGSGDYQYRFYFKELSASAYTMVQDYGVGSSWTLPGSTPPGIYRVLVYVRTNPSGPQDAQTGVNFTLQGTSQPATGVTVTPSLPSPQVASAGVTFDAQGIGGSGGYQYRFYFKEATASAYTMVQDYGVGSSWTLPSDTPAGTYRVLVYVRTSPSVLRDAMAGVNYTVRNEPATGLTVTPTPSSPQPAGTPITFTAQGIGGTGDYQYRFHFKEATAAAYTMVQDYGAGSSWTLPPNTPPGTYRVLVYVRTSPSGSQDVQAGVNFTLTEMTVTQN